jgi:iron complex transport system substrate-binding protein
MPIFVLALQGAPGTQPSPTLATSPPTPSAGPQRIVSLAPSLTETVFALGLGDRLVGVSTYCDYPPEATRIDRVGTFLTPNVEAIVVKRPDVVLAIPSPGNRGGVDALQQLGMRVIVVDPGSLEEIKQMILRLGRDLEREREANALVGHIDDHLARVQARVAGVPRRKTLMVVGHTPLIAVGRGTFQDELIDLAGGTNVAAAADSSWPHLSLEYAIAAAPEVIVDTTMGNEERPGASAALAFWEQYPTIPAVRSGHVYGYKDYQLLRPGPRIGQASEAMARYLHPEKFEP